MIRIHPTSFFSSKTSRLFIVGGLLLALPFTVLVSQQQQNTKQEAATTNFYVDCSRPDDTGDGKTQASAWKTLRKANAAILIPGDKLLLKKGCVWSGERLDPKWNGTTDAYITIGSYGIGEMPIIKNAPAVLVSGDKYYSDNITISGSYLILDGIFQHVTAILEWIRPVGVENHHRSYPFEDSCHVLKKYHLK